MYRRPGPAEAGSHVLSPAERRHRTCEAGASMLETILHQLAGKLNGWLNQTILMLPNLAAALLTVLAFWILARIVSNVTGRALQRATSYREINLLLTRLVWTG